MRENPRMGRDREQTSEQAPDRSEQAPGRLSRATRGLGKVALGAALVGTGIAHLTTLREEFQAQVPEWMPFDPDDVVVWSGWAEIALGATTLLVWKQPGRARLGALGAAFFLAVFPGNVAQWLERKDGFGLDTDQKRMARLAFQPVLIAGALYAGDTRRQRRLSRVESKS
jgi:uncharacterized membrane protein